MAPRKVLLYYMSNTHSVPMETICHAVREAGHEIVLLTMSEKGTLHEAVEKMGIKTYAHALPRKPSWKFFLHHTRYLVRFCRENKINTIWSHFPEADVIAILAGRYLKIKVANFRHHDESAFYAEYGKKFGMVRNRNEILLDKFINRFSKKIVVLSPHVLHTMKVYEKCNEKKIVVCPLMYDFSRYELPDRAVVEKIREDLPCRLRLIMVSRMIASKQHLPVFEILQKLIREGLSIKMIVMDDGPLRQVLQNYIREHRLDRDIIMPGYRADIDNYMAASDMLIHPSLTEASNNVVKEIGFMEKAVAVCKGVGDFDDYIKDTVSGYFMERGELEASVESVIRKAYANREQLSEMGRQLKKNVLQRFADTAENRERFLQLV